MKGRWKDLTSPLFLFGIREHVTAPQADNLEKVKNLIEIVGLGLRSSSDVAKKLRMDPRQSSYYREAAEVLGFLNARKPYTLTDVGRQFLLSDDTVKLKLMVGALLRVPIIAHTVASLQSRVVTSVTRQDLEDLVKRASNVRGTTVKRRAQTILAWMRWMGDNHGILSVERDTIRLQAQRKISD